MFADTSAAAVIPYILLPHLNPVAVACFTVAYAIIIPTSLAGNIMNIYAIRRNPTLKTTTNFLILNLCSADLITTFLSCPYRIASLFVGKRWFQGNFADFFCKFLPYSKNVTLTASIVTLVLISIDRFYSVYYPTKRSPIATHKRKLVLVTWILSIVLPILTYIEQKNNLFADGNYYCYYKSILGSVALSTIVGYVIIKTFLFFSVPIAIMCTLYTFIYNKLWNREVIGSSLQHVAVNKRVTMAMVAIVTNFIICWLPLEVCTYLDFIYQYISSGSMAHAKVFSYLVWNMNSATNPWLYAYFNKALRLHHVNLLTDLTTFFSHRRGKVNNQIHVMESTRVEKNAGSLSVGANGSTATAPH